MGITTGDGLHGVWDGGFASTARANWRGERIDAQTALPWRVVSEVVTAVARMPTLAARPAPSPTLQMQTLNIKLRRRITHDVSVRDGVQKPEGGQPGLRN